MSVRVRARIGTQEATRSPLTAAAAAQDAQDKAADQTRRAVPTPPQVSAAEHTAILQTANAKVEKLEPRLAAILETILRRYGDIAADKFVQHVINPEAIVSAASWTSPYPDQLIDVEALVAEILDKTDPIRQALIAQVMGPALSNAGLKYDVHNPLIAGQLANTGDQVRNIADTTRDNIVRIIGRAADSGLTIPQTAKLIQTGMRSAAASRATMIARTELGRAVNGASLASTQMVSKVTRQTYQKVWMTAPGAKWPRHEDYDGLDGQTVNLNEAFQVGTAELQYPGDPDGPPDETIMCRCALTYADVAPAGEIVLPDGTVVGNPVPDVGPPATDTVSVGNSAPVPAHLVNRINELGLDQPLAEIRPNTQVGRQIFRREPDTEHLYNFGKPYTPEREQVHDEIVASFFKGKVAPPKAQYEFFTGGGGASGKSAARFTVDGEEVTTKELDARPDWVVIDPDEVKKMLPEYKVLNSNGDLFAAGGVHEESSTLAKRIVQEAHDRGFNVLNDTTASNDKFAGKLAAAHAEGKEVQVSMFSIPTNRAIERSIARAENPDSSSYGRYVPTQSLKGAHKGASRQLAVWKDQPGVDAWKVYDNSGSSPVIVAEKKLGEDPVIYDPQAFADILAKADETPGSAGASVTQAPAERASLPGEGFTMPPPIYEDGMTGEVKGLYAEQKLDTDTLVKTAQQAVDDMPERLVHGYTGDTGFWISDGKFYKWGDWSKMSAEEKSRAVPVHSHSGVNYFYSTLAETHEPWSPADIYQWFAGLRKGTQGGRQMLLYADGRADIVGIGPETNIKALGFGEKRLRASWEKAGWYPQASADAKREALNGWFKDNGFTVQEIQFDDPNRLIDVAAGDKQLDPNSLRMRSDERALMAPTDTVENQTVSLDPGKQDIDDALASISQQINSPDTLKTITTKVVGQITTLRGSSAEGLFEPTLTGGSIKIKRLTDRYAVFTHEYGHAWDHLNADTSRTVPIIDPSGTVLDHLSETYATQNIQEAGLGEWYQAVTESPTYQKLWGALQDGAARAERAGESLLGNDPVFVDGDPYLAGNVLYVINEQELFARAFVQWLSGQDARLAEHVREKLALDHQELGAWYWPPKEFEPIAKTMTSYFRDRGFIPGVPASPEYAAEVAARSAGEAAVQTSPTMTVSEARAALVEDKSYDAVHSPLHAVGDEWYHSLDSEEEHVLDRYTRRGYMWMNARLKGDRYWKDEGEGSAPDAAEADRQITELHDAIEKAPDLPADTTLYRAWDPFESVLKKEWDELPGGQRFDTPEERKLLMDWVQEHMPVGSEIQPAGGGFQSWTADSQFAAHFHGGSRVSVVYEVPNATHGASLFTINQSEREVLVSNDQHYIIKDMHFEDVPVEGPVSATMPSASPRLVVTLEEVPG